VDGVLLGVAEPALCKFLQQFDFRHCINLRILFVVRGMIARNL